MRFGFINDKIYTQEEIADKLNISQRHVSRLIKKS
jgi:DNA-directed RNA polymerase specialized sigma subunit